MHKKIIKYFKRNKKSQNKIKILTTKLEITYNKQKNLNRKIFITKNKFQI